MGTHVPYILKKNKNSKAVIFYTTLTIFFTEHTSVNVNITILINRKGAFFQSNRKTFRYIPVTRTKLVVNINWTPQTTHPSCLFTDSKFTVTSRKTQKAERWGSSLRKSTKTLQFFARWRAQKKTKNKIKRKPKKKKNPF